MQIWTLSTDRLDCTGALQARIDADALPLTILIKGQHRCGALRLRSDLTINLAAGARLDMVGGYDDFAANTVGVIAEDSDRAMIVAQDARNIKIIGQGAITCNGVAGFAQGEDSDMGTRRPAAFRPRVLVFDGCQGIEISGLRIEDSPMWTLHFVACTNVTLTGLTILNDRRMPNTDGIVLDACTNVRVSGCTIRTADDGVVLKTSDKLGQPAGACRDIRVTDCTVESLSCALKIGTESHGDFADIHFADCRIEASNRGLGIFSRDGGAVTNVSFTNITLECRETPDGFWGSGEAVTINALSRRPDVRQAGAITDVRFAGISGSTEGAINIYAESPDLIIGLSLDDIELHQRAGDLGTALRYDLRPSPADLSLETGDAGRPNAWRKGPDGRIMGLHPYPGGMPTAYFHNARPAIGQFSVSRPDVLPENWNPELIIATQD